MPESVTRKLHPKLRMIENSAFAVNAVRSTMCSAMTTKADTSPVDVRDASANVSRSKAKISDLKETAEGILVNVFIHTTNGLEVPQAAKAAVGTPVRRGQLMTMTVPLNSLRDIASAKNVTLVEAGQALAAPSPVVSATDVQEPDPKARAFGDNAMQKKHRFGEDVLIGIVDVGGFDFSHPDFQNAEGTRWLRIWDQGATEGTPPGQIGDVRFDYGHQFLKADLDNAIAQSGKLKVPAWALERQSQTEPGSHGTHVASIAAGNHGICRRAKIAGVLVALTKDDVDRRRSFYDSTRVAHAVEYLVALAKQEDLRLSINISLGTNGAAHDGSSAISRWIDNALTTPGRAVSIAAGNAGQESATSPDDLGWIFGRIHTSGTIESAGLAKDIEWIVAGDGFWDVSENELEIWYSPQDRFDVMLKPPGGEWIGPVKAGEYIENRQIDDKTLISIYNELYQPSNGANYIAIYLSPYMSNDLYLGIRQGVWIVRLIGRDVRDGSYHGWIERDFFGEYDPASHRYYYPSYFSERSNVDNSSVGSLACGMRVLSVANLDDAREAIHVTSSQGPTRDGRFKPDIAAPGTDIVAANGFAGAGDQWIAMSGTSMASPFMCGVAGLMLNVRGDLTAAQIEGIVRRTALPLPGTAYTWANDAGFGRLNPNGCLAEAATINDRKELK